MFIFMLIYIYMCVCVYIYIIIILIIIRAPRAALLQLAVFDYGHAQGLRQKSASVGTFVSLSGWGNGLALSHSEIPDQVLSAGHAHQHVTNQRAHFYFATKCYKR